MDRQRLVIVGTTTAVITVLVLGVGFLMGRASAGEGASTAESQLATDSAALPAGPTGIEGGVPTGFAQTEDGVLSAALAWVPWLLSSPASERPDGIESVLARGVELPLPDGISQRLQYVPWAAGVEMDSASEATVTLWGTPLRGEPGQDLDGGVWLVTATLAWDGDAGDWRVTAAEFSDGPVEFPISASDVAGLRVVRFTGGVLGGPVIEEVPGD